MARVPPPLPPRSDPPHNSMIFSIFGIIIGALTIVLGFATWLQGRRRWSRGIVECDNGLRWRIITVADPSTELVPIRGNNGNINDSDGDDESHQHSRLDPNEDGHRFYAELEG
ncbi:hypothetical protein FGG08_004724 [Glutinoglossum americanum]|uniref:Uncharacterized protein n=1 Tax=Glutinoglossum americanum TaxID=1670608 RepID=A0A9P8I4Q1_9PEZI|nr:hypothetical protein FGG08_004724 [Glutinoglossum americanum]